MTLNDSYWPIQTPLTLIDSYWLCFYWLLLTQLTPTDSYRLHWLLLTQLALTIVLLVFTDYSFLLTIHYIDYYWLLLTLFTRILQILTDSIDLYWLIHSINFYWFYWLLLTLLTITDSYWLNWLLLTQLALLFTGSYWLFIFTDYLLRFTLTIILIMCNEKGRLHSPHHRQHIFWVAKTGGEIEQSNILLQLLHLWCMWVVYVTGSLTLCSLYCSVKRQFLAHSPTLQY